MSPTGLSVFDTITTSIWIFKPLMGFITDSYTIFGTKRKYYLIFSSIVQMIAWLYLSFFVNEFWGAVAVKLLINIASGFINVIGEAMMVELS